MLVSHARCVSPLADMQLMSVPLTGWLRRHGYRCPKNCTSQDLVLAEVLRQLEYHFCVKQQNPVVSPTICLPAGVILWEICSGAPLKSRALGPLR